MKELKAAELSARSVEEIRAKWRSGMVRPACCLELVAVVCLVVDPMAVVGARLAVWLALSMLGLLPTACRPGRLRPQKQQGIVSPPRERQPFPSPRPQPLAGPAAGAPAAAGAAALLASAGTAARPAAAATPIGAAGGSGAAAMAPVTGAAPAVAAHWQHPSAFPAAQTGRLQVGEDEWCSYA